MSHLAFSSVTAVLLSSAMALIGNRSPRERWYAVTYLLFCCGLTTVGGSWLMFLIHR